MKTLFPCLLFSLISGLCISQCESGEIELRIEILTDEWAGETYWTLSDEEENVILQGGQDGVYENLTNYSDSICVDSTMCYTFEIWDTYSDGINAPGGYECYADDELVAAGAVDIGPYASVDMLCPDYCGTFENEVKFRVEIDTDQWGGETSWAITDLDGEVIMEGGQDGTYANFQSYADSICVDYNGCYYFEIWDTFGDGINAPGGYELYVDNVLLSSGSDDIGSYQNATVHCPVACDIMENAINGLHNHIIGVDLLDESALLAIRDTLWLFPECLAESEEIILLAKETVSAYDVQEGPLFTTPETEYGFSKDPTVDTGLELEHAMLALEQAIFDYTFSPQVYAESPEHLYQWKFNSCQAYPGAAPYPEDSTITYTRIIRATFEDPAGMNPYFNINGDGTDHALRPTGAYLAPGSWATVTVPEELVGQDFWVRVGSHEWDLTERPRFKRLDRISKKFPIEETTVVVFNPLGGAISILVPFGASEGNVEVSVNNALEAPFFSIKSFDVTADPASELDKPAPWAVFESENVMYTVPVVTIEDGPDDLLANLQEWETAVRGVNSIMAREIIPDKHTMYMITDLIIRAPAYSIGYPMSNSPLNLIDPFPPAYFMDGPGPNYRVNFHETGHALAMSKFPGEIEALVNMPYVMAMNYSLGVELDEAVNHSFVPTTFDVDKTATHRMVSDSFGGERDISNTVTDEVRYQHRGCGHYFEIVNMLGWCPLRNFWRSEYLDFQNGIDHGINNQEIDSRILRMSVAAQADLRSLFYVYGILPQDPEALQEALEDAGIEPSLIIYNRLQEYFDLIPEDNEAFVDYALFVYPNLYTDGPKADPNYGVGWHYLKSLSYNAEEAQERADILQDIIDIYFPSGAPDESGDVDVCCTLDPLSFTIDGNEVIITGGVEPYDITIEDEGETLIVTVIDYDNCVATNNPTTVTERAERQITVFPNPSSGDVQIDFGSTQDQVTISVIDTQGRKLESRTAQTGGLMTFHLPRSVGVYILEMTFKNGGHAVARVVKQ
ncbi:MAG: T9SS type A sorting domain-containing protein [Flavobacteriales bacterium]|nr:T9SS type A sorting domain-containing protein [Flavobacteriales bacterium]